MAPDFENSSRSFAPKKKFPWSFYRSVPGDKMKRRHEEQEKKRIQQEIRDYVFSEHPEIAAVYLFGSYLTAVAFKDIDIGLLSKAPVDTPMDLELTIECDLEKRLGVPLDIRLLNHAPPAFCFNVFKQGTIILDRNPNFRADFECRQLKKYFDFQPFLKRYLKEAVDAAI
jgi:predicted nucleotidyltransferase